MKTALILGGGFAGCTAAYFLNKKKFRVKLIEGGNNLGGGVWTNYHGEHPYTFGPRIFFSKKDSIIEHLTSMIEIREFFTKSWTYVENDNQLYNYPIQYSDINQMPDSNQINQELQNIKTKEISTKNFEDYWISVIGERLYSKFVKDYSTKMWGIESNKQLIANFEWVNRGIPIRDGDNRLYQDQFQGYPKNLDGYNEYFQKSVKDIEFHLNIKIMRFDPEKKNVYLSNGEKITADIIVNTIHVDSLLNNIYGKLQYCGRDFIPLWLPIEFALPENVTWIHYSGKEKHTRVTEFKKITNFKSKSTLLGIEIPSQNGRFYPVQSESEIKKFSLYKKEFPNNFFSIGRLGKFVYQGIPEAIEDSIELNKIV